MIKIVATMPVDATKIDEFKALAKVLVEGSAAEEGNISYTLNVSKKDPSVFVVMECWKDEAAIAFHNNTEHFTTSLPKMAALCTGEITIDLFDEVEL